MGKILTIEEFYKDGTTYTKYGGNYTAYREENDPSVNPSDKARQRGWTNVQANSASTVTADPQGTADKTLADMAAEVYQKDAEPTAEQENNPQPETQGTVDDTLTDIAADMYRKQVDGKTGYEKWKESGNYQDLLRYYDEQSRRAMDDTLGRISARTGGMASSYAVGAAEGARDEVMLQLENMARSMYEGDRADARARIAAYLQNGGDPAMLAEEVKANSGYTDDELAQMYRAAGTTKSPYYDSIATDLKSKDEKTAVTNLTGLVERGFITEDEMHRLLIGQFGHLPMFTGSDTEATQAGIGRDIEEADFYEMAGQTAPAVVGEIDVNRKAEYKNNGAKSYKQGDNVQIKIGDITYRVQIGEEAGDDVKQAARAANMRYGVFGYDNDIYVAANGSVYKLEKRTGAYKEHYNKLVTDFYK